MSIKLSPFLAFFAVTVHAAVWIEIFPCADPPRLSLVTVHAAVWIEIVYVHQIVRILFGHRPRGGVD